VKYAANCRLTVCGFGAAVVMMRFASVQRAYDSVHSDEVLAEMLAAAAGIPLNRLA